MELVNDVRPPAIAGTFFPADAGPLAASVDGHLAQSAAAEYTPKAIIAPHAGHVFSGPIAGAVYATLHAVSAEIRRVVMIGPCHRVPVRGFAVPSHRLWRSPLGDVPLDRVTIDRLSSFAGVEVKDECHTEEHCLEVQLPFLQRILSDFSIVPILVGRADPPQVEALLRELWGGPETLIVISSDLSHYHDYASAQKLDGAASLAIECLRPRQINDDQACGRIPIKGLLRRARALDMRVTTLDLRNSGDTAGTKDRVVGYGAYGFEYAHSARLSDEHRKMLGDLGRGVISAAVENGGRMPRVVANTLAPQLRSARATFVTLKIGGKLRGCIGSITPSRSLALDVAENSFKAGFGDPRFPALSAEDRDRIDISVSILSTPRQLECRTEAQLVADLNPDRDGVILVDGEKRGLFLPQVWESLPDPQDFVRHLKGKARLPEDHWSDAIQFYRFSTESFDCPRQN
ncbi:MAG: AmmeMemoRadiSam system protein B [Alphaproteobacteria bacterium]|nr:AmmeMemoRadiSam system protein B [Alphaproteobacteria bacterium]